MKLVKTALGCAALVCVAGCAGNSEGLTKTLNAIGTAAAIAVEVTNPTPSPTSSVVVQKPVVTAPAITAPTVSAPVVQAPAVQAPAVSAPALPAAVDTSAFARMSTTAADAEEPTWKYGVLTFKKPATPAQVAAAKEKLAGETIQPANLRLSFENVDEATLAAAFLQFPNAGRVTIDKSNLASVRSLALLRDVTRLELKNLKALDLTPVAGMAKLKTLSLTYSQIDDFTPLAGLAALTDLECYGAEVKSFAPLAACPNLDRVYFYAAKSTPEGYASLGLLKQVKKFHGGLTKMTSVAWLRQVPQAEEVKIFAEKIDDLSPIGSLPNLTYLRLWDMNGGALSTAVGNLAFLANCKKLEVLELPGSSFTNTDALAGLTALKSVDLSGGRNAQPVSIAFATKLPGLARLNLSDANVIDGALVASLPKTVRVTTNDKTQGVPKN